MIDIEQHEAFEVRFLEEVAQHSDKPDYSVISVEIENKLNVVSILTRLLSVITDDCSPSTCLPSVQVGRAVQPMDCSLKPELVYCSLGSTLSSSHVAYVPSSEHS
jgi:hypothetical protein